MARNPISHAHGGGRGRWRSGAVEVTDSLLVNNVHGRPQSVTNPDLLTQDDRGLAMT